MADRMTVRQWVWYLLPLRRRLYLLSVRHTIKNVYRAWRELRDALSDFAWSLRGEFF